MKISIIIPHRGNPLGLWATIHSCDEELRHGNVDYEYVIVSNGEALENEAKQCLYYLEKTGKLAKHFHSDEPLTPPTARQRGVENSTGELLCFFDNHCLLGRDYFDRALADFNHYGADMDMLHSTTCFYTSDEFHYHYKLKLDYNFWAESAKLPEISYKPYRIAAGGHGGFFVRRSVWDEVGGYGPEDLFIGYGGEEMIFDLKVCRYGKKNWIDPKIIHYHYTGKRGYDRHYTDDYYCNMMIAANVIGGNAWVDRVLESLVTNNHIRLRPKKEFVELAEEAISRSAKFAAEVDARSVITLDNLLKEFRYTQVAM